MNNEQFVEWVTFLIKKFSEEGKFLSPQEYETITKLMAATVRPEQRSLEKIYMSPFQTEYLKDKEPNNNPPPQFAHPVVPVTG